MILVVACGTSASQVAVTDAVTPVPANPAEASVYLTISNSGGADDELTAATTDVAEMTHLHETKIDKSGRAMMDMRSSVDVPAGETVRFSPGKLHLMLMQPKTLHEGDTFVLWLHFEKAGDIKTTVRVVGEVDPVG